MTVAEGGDDMVVIEGGIHRRPILRHGYWPLVASLTKQEFRTRYRQSALHIAWLVIQPAMLVAVYALVFKGILRIGTESVPYLSFIVAGFVPWRFYSGALGSAAAISENPSLVSKVYFPREVIPVTNTLLGIPELLVGTVIMIGVVLFQGFELSIHMLALPFAYALLLLCTINITVVLTAVAVFARDLSHSLPIVLMLIFFGTPIMYPEELVPSSLAWLNAINPLSVVIASARAGVLEDQWPQWNLLLLHTVIAAVGVWVSFAYMRAVEHRMPDIA